MLKMGLLWFDDNPKRPLAEKLDEAVERYQERFDVRPTLAHMNPSQAAGLKYKRLQVHEDESLRRNYFIVGVDEADIASGALLSSSLVSAPARPARKAQAAPVALEPV